MSRDCAKHRVPMMYTSTVILENVWGSLAVPTGESFEEPFGFHVEPFPQRVLNGAQKGSNLEPKRVLPGTKKGSPMGTDEEPFWNHFL